MNKVKKQYESNEVIRENITNKLNSINDNNSELIFSLEEMSYMCARFIEQHTNKKVNKALSSSGVSGVFKYKVIIDTSKKSA